MMQTINKQQLLDAFEVVKPGLANKNVIEQAACFAFVDGHVVTYNDEISVRHPFPVQLSGAVKAEEFYSLLSKIKAEQVEMEVTESEIKLSAGRTKAGLPLFCEIKLPLEEIGDITDWKDLPSDFVDAASFCLFSCSRDMSRPILTCVHINGSMTESCDNHRITRAFMKSKMPLKESLLIPASSLAQIIKFPLKQIAKQTNGWIHFKTKLNTVISIRVFAADKYVDTSSVLESAEGGNQLKLPAALETALERTGIFAKKETELDAVVFITVADKRFKIKASNDAGWISEELNIAYKGPEISFAIHPGTLRDILKKTDKFSVTDSCIKFEGENWIHVAALLATGDSSKVE